MIWSNLKLLVSYWLGVKVISVFESCCIHLLLLGVSLGRIRQKTFIFYINLYGRKRKLRRSNPTSLTRFRKSARKSNSTQRVRNDKWARNKQRRPIDSDSSRSSGAGACVAERAFYVSVRQRDWRWSFFIL